MYTKLEDKQKTMKPQTTINTKFVLKRFLEKINGTNIKEFFIH